MKKLSVIIPTLNDERSIATTLKLSTLPGIECIVVDGGSTDRTVKIAKSLGAKILHARPGRAHQMNIGAAAAQSKTLLFLHADTLPPARFPAIVKVTLSQPKTIAGAFSFKLNGTNVWFHFIEFYANLRASLRQLPLSDQGLFIRKHVFDELGGFPDVPMMEYYLFIRRLRQYGTIRTTISAAIASTRRWEKRGILRTALADQLIIAALHLHISPAKLEKLYHRQKRNTARRNQTHTRTRR
jgi:rSAM/selenodomain-associated transferase 2